MNSQLNVIYDDSLTLVINSQTIEIPGVNDYGQEKNINITSNLKTGENIALFYVFNLKNYEGYLRFYIEIQQEVLV